MRLLKDIVIVFQKLKLTAHIQHTLACKEPCIESLSVAAKHA